jgi:hypothetical protein
MRGLVKIEEAAALGGTGESSRGQEILRRLNVAAYFFLIRRAPFQEAALDEVFQIR